MFASPSGSRRAERDVLIGSDRPKVAAERLSSFSLVTIPTAAAVGDDSSAG